MQFNPYAYRRSLLDACEENDVVLVAYSPLGLDAISAALDRTGGTDRALERKWWR